MSSLPLLTVIIPIQAYLSHDALQDKKGRRGRLRYKIDSCSGVFRIEISPQRQAILLEIFSGLICLSRKIPESYIKDEACLFYIRTQCVQRCKHSPLRL
jgi:hypothetical protein